MSAVEAIVLGGPLHGQMIASPVRALRVALPSRKSLRWDEHADATTAVGWREGRYEAVRCAIGHGPRDGATWFVWVPADFPTEWPLQDYLDAVNFMYAVTGRLATLSPLIVSWLPDER